MLRKLEDVGTGELVGPSVLKAESRPRHRTVSCTALEDTSDKVSEEYDDGTVRLAVFEDWIRRRPVTSMWRGTSRSDNYAASMHRYIFPCNLPRER